MVNKTWKDEIFSNCIGGVMIIVLASSALYRGFKTKDYDIGICCISSKHPA